MENACAFLKFFLHFANLYPSTPQAPLNLELSTCLKQCVDSGSCLSVFYDKSKKECLHFEIFLSADDSSLMTKQGTVYYGYDKAPLEIECTSTPGYQLHGSGLCLRPANTSIKETWSAARRSCENDGASLLKIGSREKDNALKLVLGREKEWAGGSDWAIEGVFVWRDGTPVQGFTDWYGSEPDGGTSQNCMMINANGWYDSGSRNARKYMCEKNIK